MKKDKAYLQDMLDAICDIEKFTENITQDEFYKNKEKQYAVLRALEIVGEATKKLSKELKARHREISWREIAGMRDKLIHEYFGVNTDVIWNTVKQDIPTLKVKVREIVTELVPNSN
jgi:uncharacterized protein with HEPN domain